MTFDRRAAPTQLNFDFPSQTSFKNFVLAYPAILLKPRHDRPVINLRSS